MLSQKVTVTYFDETTAETVITQWSMSQFALWANAKGLKVDMSNPGLMGVVMFRYQAWAEVHRGSQHRPTFDAWDATVLSVDPVEEPTEADPTETEVSVT